MSNANRRATSSAARLTSSRRPTGSSSRSSIGTVMTLSQLMTQRSGSPCSGPTSTSVRIPRIVRVIGAHVTELNTAMAASRVRMQTGRRPAGGPRSAKMMSFRATTPARSAPRDGAPTARVQGRVAGAGTRRRALGQLLPVLRRRSPRWRPCEATRTGSFRAAPQAHRDPATPNYPANCLQRRDRPRRRVRIALPSGRRHRRDQ